jgi:ABC-2 type transport system ATP-binding protein
MTSYRWAIETFELRKEYGEKVAVEGLSLQVAPGEVFGFLGPNGAGKTTSVKMMLGLVHPTSASGWAFCRSISASTNGCAPTNSSICTANFAA